MIRVTTIFILIYKLHKIIFMNFIKNSLLLICIFVLILQSCKKQNNPNYISRIVGVYTVKKIDKYIDISGNITYQYDSGLMEIKTTTTSMTSWFFHESSNFINVDMYYSAFDLISTNTVNKTLGFGRTTIIPGLGRIDDTLIFNYETNIINEYIYDPSNNPYFTQITGTKN